MGYLQNGNVYGETDDVSPLDVGILNVQRNLCKVFHVCLTFEGCDRTNSNWPIPSGTSPTWKVRGCPGHQPERFAGVPVSSIIYARLAFYIHNVYIICMYLYTYVHIHIFIYIWVCLCVLSLFQASLQRDVRFKYHTQWIKSYNIDCSTHTVGIPPIYCIQFLRLGSWRKCDIVFIAFAGKICILYVSLMHMYIYIHNLVICILKIKDNLYIVPYLKDPCFWS